MVCKPPAVLGEPLLLLLLLLSPTPRKKGDVSGAHCGERGAALAIFLAGDVERDALLRLCLSGWEFADASPQMVDIRLHQLSARRRPCDTEE